MAERIVDLRSDTTTRPTDEMREAMKLAEVGDDAFGEDPTVNRLQDLAAHKLGMEAALLLPTGSMANGLALLLHTQPGDTFFCHERAHVMGRQPFHTTGGVTPHTFATPFGVINPDLLAGLIEATRAEGGNPSLLCIENSHNFSGGYAWQLEEVEAATTAARSHNLKIHMDGARLFNSCVSLGIDAGDYAKHVDSVMFCVSKGLSAPVGSLLCGRANFIEEARTLRSGIGGTMRQAGTIASAGIIALEKMVDRLADDHEHAKLLCQGLLTINGITPRQPPNPTNFVMANATELEWSSEELSERLQTHGVLAIQRPPHDLRLVLHRHLTGDDVDYTIEAFRAVAAAA